MKNLGIIFSIFVIIIVFTYSMLYLSSNNTCTGVRVFDCQKNEKKNLVTGEKYIELKPTGDIFLKYCNPKITIEENNYLIDYSVCNLKVAILKDKPWVDTVEVNNEKLTREQINSNF